tara:strand:- start:3791 stop:4165 length:375 start_codon:yes stop_codon:yes gene_type:complete
MIALKKEAFDHIKKEAIYIGTLFLLALIIFKIAFYKENIVWLLKTVLSIFWLFVLPGYFIMLYWKEKLGFIERILAGILISAAIIGISSYYISLAGINLRYHSFLLPSILILIGIVINLRRKSA